MKNEEQSAFAEYLLKKRYSEATIASYCRLLKLLKIDNSISEPLKLYENINKCLKEYSVHSDIRSATISKVVANRYFEMKTGQHISEYIKDVHEMSILNDFYQYSVDFKKMTIEASKAECQHIQVFLKRVKKSTDIPLISPNLLDKDLRLMDFIGDICHANITERGCIYEIKLVA